MTDSKHSRTSPRIMVVHEIDSSMSQFLVNAILFCNSIVETEIIFLELTLLALPIKYL